MENTYERMTEVVYHPNDKDTYKWVRSSQGWLAGVCEGLAPRFGMPIWAMRLIWVLGTLLAFGTGIFLYLILALCLPEENSLHEAENKKALGVCLRLSRAFNMEVGLVRVLTVLLGLASLGITIVGYIILHFIVPERPHPIR